MTFLAARPLLRASRCPVVARSTAPCALAAYEAPLALLSDVGNPVSDLFQSPVAVAYLGVLTVLFGFLGFLAYSDAQGKARRREAAAQRAQAMEEMARVTPQLREQGKDEEADAIEREMDRLRAAEMSSSAAPSPPGRQREKAPMWMPGGAFVAPGTEPSSLEDTGNRFMRRQGAGLEEGGGAAPLKKTRRRQRARRGAAARAARSEK